MIIYHGSIDMVETPEIRESNRTLDYGRGKYHDFVRTGGVMGEA